MWLLRRLFPLQRLRPPSIIASGGSYAVHRFPSLRSIAPDGTASFHQSNPRGGSATSHRLREISPYLQVKNTLKSCTLCTRTMIDIVLLLNATGIPSLLWWNSMIDIYGIPTGDIEMSFLIDRHLIQKAADTLAYAGLAPCVSENCRSRPPSIGGSGNFANPAFHFHVPFEFEEAPVNKINTSWPSIQLHIQDERVWTLPLQYDAPVTDSNNIIFADDVRLPLPNWHPVYFNDTYKGRCRHAPGSPVRILTPERYAEALLLLKIRDQGSFAANLWQTQINYLAEYDLVNMDMVNGPTRSFMTSLLRISLRENMENARAKLGEIAMQGLMHAEWAEKYV